MRPTNLIARTLGTASRQLSMAVGLAGALAATAAPAFARPLPTTTVVSAAAHANTAPRGVFRVDVRGGASGSAPATIIIERVGDHVEATLLMDERITALDHVRTDGERMTAEVKTSLGSGRVSLVVDGDAVTGTLTVGRHTYTLTGTRSA